MRKQLISIPTILLIAVILSTILTTPTNSRPLQQDDITPVSPIFLPIVYNKFTPSPPINKSNHTTGNDGIVTVPLSQGGVTTFRMVDRLHIPIQGIEVIAIENTAGVTLIINSIAEGFYPRLFSAPAIGNSSEHYALAVMSTYDVRLDPLNSDGAYVYEDDLILEHLQSLPQNYPEWAEKFTTVSQVCESVIDGVEGATWVITLLEPTKIGVVVHVMITVVVESVKPAFCEEIIAGGNPVQEYLTIENTEMGMQFLGWEGTIENTTGIAVGQVVDASNYDGISNVTVNVDNSPLLQTTTHTNGWYRIEGIPPGTHQVIASRNGYNGGSTTVNVAMNEASWAPFIILSVNNPGILRMQNLTGGELTLEVVDQGTFDITANEIYDWELPAGTYHLIAWTTACGGIAEADVTITAGETLPLYASCGQAASVTFDKISRRK